MRDISNPVDEVQYLAAYLEGAASATSHTQDRTALERAARWLDKLGNHNVCAGGIIGCPGGRRCTSDHK